jgi:CRISPR-associated protein Csb2
MLSLGIHYLNGWAMAAADGANKAHAEWPPHPDRVFMALAAAWFETGEVPDEGAALTWLESLPPPQIVATDAEPRGTDTGRQQPVSYVPVNDTRASKKPPAASSIDKLKDAGLGLLPEHRLRQARHFPVVYPHEPYVHLVWPEADPSDHYNALQRLARKVTNIGHSASLVQAWVDSRPIAPRWVPTQGVAEYRLRIMGPGRLIHLRERCNRDAVIAHGDLQARIMAAKGKEKKMLKAELQDRFGDVAPISLRPEPGLWQGYTSVRDQTEVKLPGSLFDPRLLVFTLHGQGLPLSATLRATNALRCTLLKDIAALHCTRSPTIGTGNIDQAASLTAAFDYPEWLCGHAPGGGATRQPHLAFAPLPFVQARHADGRIMGLALILPKALDQAEAGQLLEPWLRNPRTGVTSKIKLFDGQWLKATIELDTRENRPASLRPEGWTAARTGACQWASVTPVVLDRHFKGADKWNKAAEAVKDACERIDLPRPIDVELHPVSRVRGVPRANEFPYLSRKQDGGRMHHAHAFIQFAEPVVGPLLIGAGRFRGYGLCRPLHPCNPPAMEAANNA